MSIQNWPLNDIHLVICLVISYLRKWEIVSNSTFGLAHESRVLFQLNLSIHHVGIQNRFIFDSELAIMASLSFAVLLFFYVLHLIIIIKLRVNNFR